MKLQLLTRITDNTGAVIDLSARRSPGAAPRFQLDFRRHSRGKIYETVVMRGRELSAFADLISQRYVSARDGSGDRASLTVSGARACDGRRLEVRSIRGHQSFADSVAIHSYGPRGGLRFYVVFHLYQAERVAAAIRAQLPGNQAGAA